MNNNEANIEKIDKQYDVNAIQYGKTNSEYIYLCINNIKLIAFMR